MSVNKTGRPDATAQGPATNHDDTRASIRYLVETLMRNGVLPDFDRTYAYDGSSRLSTITYNEMLASATGDTPARANGTRRAYRVTFSYDGSSRLSKRFFEYSTNNAGTWNPLYATANCAAVNYGYDGQSRLSTETWSAS